MHQPNILLTSLEIVATILCFINPTTQGQQYFITGPTGSQFYRQNTNDYTSQQIPPFRQASPEFQPIDSYFPQRDLQTSDLPFHLQQTLPQYRITTKEPPLLFQQQQQFQSPPTPFRPQSHQNIVPSTHRPNYPHLFSHAHNKNPSRTEQFLGEITLQSPAELPPTFNNNDFKPSTVPLFPSQSKIPSKTSGGFESVNQNLDYTEKPPVRDNSVQLNSGRESFLNHRSRIFAPDSSKEVNKLQVKDYFVNNNGDVFVTTKAPTTTSSSVKPSKRPAPKNTFDLESLLEEPIKKHSSENDDVVEIIKSIEVTGSTTEEPQETTDYDYDNGHNSTSSVEYIEYEDEEPIDEEETDEHNDAPENDEEENKSEEVLERTGVPSTESPDSSSIAEDEEGDQPKQPELVVSVVTTKSVVNNTIIAPPVPVNITTQSSDVEDSSTDSWRVIASVQTSRSVSGGKADGRAELLNEDSEEHTESQQDPEHKDEEDENNKPKDVEDEISEDKDTENAEDTSTDDGDKEVATTVEAITSTTLPPTKLKTSTESLIDKLDRVQSDLSSGLLTGEFKNDNIAVINENVQDKMHATTMFDMGVTSTTPKTTTTPKSDLPSVVIRKFSPKSRPTSRPRKVTSLPNITKQDDLTGLLPPGFKPKYQTTTTTPSPDVQGDEALKDNGTDISSLLPPGYKAKEEKIDGSNLLAEILSKVKNSSQSAEEHGHKNASKLLDHVKKDDISAFLPPGYKPSFTKPKNKTSKLETHEDDISAFLPPGYKSFKTSTTTVKSVDKTLAKAHPVDISALLPPGYKSNSTKPKGVKALLDSAKSVDINNFLPPGYKENSTDDVLSKAKPVDISSLLPPGYKANATKPKHVEAKQVDLSPFLPSEYKKNSIKPKGVHSLLDEARPVDVSAFLPPGYKPRATYKTTTTTTAASSEEPSSTTAPSTTTKKAAAGFKVVFPSRPGGGTRKSATRLTTPRSSGVEDAKPTPPSIQKGWPSRATTEFTGWPTPSTTPISIEKLLEAARAAAATSTEASSDGTSSTSSTTTTTSTTTTPKSTTPGICIKECDLVGTIKLVGGAKWVPELLDRNTKEWQILANEVQTQLENVFGESNILNKWYKKLRIDGFSEGSVLVDYLVELNDLGRQIDTIEIKRLFHESLNEALTNSSNREAKALNETMKLEGKLGLGKFVLDPTYTDFIVLPKQVYPTVGYAEDNVLLPQWAIAVIVIGLASLLFVIIFGVTVLVNRQKNAKKKAPTPLTEDMLNELNKNHMGGLDNYGAEDLYNMEDVWNDRGFDPKIPRKRSAGSLHDNSMSNLYDSWKSEWNGYYYNAYYGNNPGNSHSGYGRRRSDYDTNF